MAFNITTTEMHTGGEPLRIVESGYPEIHGENILAKRRYAKDNLDHLRKALMYEPRGHFDMYGAIIVDADIEDADFGVLFMHNEGYSTMCGHAVIALGRYALEKGLIKGEPKAPETEVKIQCPCGLVRAYVEYDAVTKKSGSVHFYSVPVFAFCVDQKIDVPEYGSVTYDIAYGGAFYAFVHAKSIGLDLETTKVNTLIEAASAISDAIKASVKLHHPDDSDLEFLYGTMLTDGKDAYSEETTLNFLAFADRQVDRCPTGSACTARIALMYHKKQLQLGQERKFKSSSTGSVFTAKPVNTVQCGKYNAVVVEVSGNAYFTGTSNFTMEDDDELGKGFLVQ